MKLTSQIKADRLRGALESCCDRCGKLSTETGEKVCCAADEAEKPEPVSTGPEGEHHTHAFIQRCVAAITQNDPDMDTGRAFAICTAQKKKSPSAARDKTKEGVPKSRVKEFERALRRGRQQRASRS